MLPRELLRAFHKHRDSGIVGVAFGLKEVDGKIDLSHQLAVSFFVKKKLPVKGGRRRLANGARKLPLFVEFQGEHHPTDVVDTEGQADTARTRSPPEVFRAGGKASNMQLTGTLGCLVRRDGQSGLWALTNKHIALEPGAAIAFPDFRTVGAIVGTTTESAGLIADEQFLKNFDEPQSYIDVDTGLVRIPPRFENQFSPDIPNLGRPAGIYQPTTSSTDNYIHSLLGRQVYSYAWPSGVRRGTVSHVYYVFEKSQFQVASVACFLVRSADTLPPGLLGDSGKLWLTNVDGGSLGIGVHFGVVADNPTSARFAMVTELAALSRLLNFKLA